MDDRTHKFHSKETKWVAGRKTSDKLIKCTVKNCEEIHEVMYSGMCGRHHEMRGYLISAGVPVEALLRIDVSRGSTTCSMPCKTRKFLD